ncbi:alpha/beta hydrolase [Lysobacter sp. A6]|uniref:Alpha/beta hydrolase n=1 Tax=Noviluteimonas lactosilytica TaxID=2888523 RepID=A0ABS8JM00_9GAMM|nr:alpha/beta hydrolase [Lysobacter lactosilyticus]MCC8364639.1 alpha/beta hydrolase [Lysobacter lactosilyticus]
MTPCFADDSMQAWMRRAIDAYRAMDSDDTGVSDTAAVDATRATAEVLAALLRQQPAGWSPGPLRTSDGDLQVEFRNVSEQLRFPLRMRSAQDVSMRAFDGQRHGREGFGVPVAVLASRSATSSMDRLTPQSGAFRNLTAWIEPDAAHVDATPRLVLADPLKLDNISIGARRFSLASDTSAAYAWAMEISKLERVGIWGLLGGKQIERRSGLYLLEDYDPRKRPLIMIHGLGSNPLIWARLTNAIWDDEDIRARYQVWHVLHQTDAPLLAARLRIQCFLDDAWRTLDPAGNHRAHSGTVLIGHSMGGVVARLLCVESGVVPWNAAFLVPPEVLDASAEDLDVIKQVFFFTPYPGVSRAIFLAAPHRGSPEAATMLGRMTGDFVGRRAIEVQAMRRIAHANSSALRPEMREVLEQGWVNSIITLQSEQPVRRATETLMPPAGIPYHTIAAVLPGRTTDGVVPLDSAMIPGATSSLVVESGHQLHESPQAIAEVLRILRE